MPSLSQLLAPVTNSDERLPEEQALGLRRNTIQKAAAESPFLSTLAGTLQGTVGGGSATALGNVTGALGLKQASDALYAKGAQLQADAAPYMAPQLDYTTVKDVGSAWDFAKANAAQGVGSMAPMMLGRALGGAPLGLAAGYLPQHGENVSRIKDDPTLAGMSEAQMLGAAAPTAALQTGLDYIVPGGVATNLARRGATALGTGALGKAGATIGTNALIEGGTELGQEELGMGMHTLLNPNRDTSGDEHARIQSFLGGAVGGAPMGAVDAGVGYLQDKVEARPPKPLNISAESDSILKSRKPLHPNLTDTEMGEALTQRDAQESAQAEQLAQKVKASQDTSPRTQKLADEFLAGDKSGPAAEAFVREVQRADTSEKLVDKAHAAGEWLHDKVFGKRLGTAYFDEEGEAHQTPTYLSQEFREMDRVSPNAVADEGMQIDKAGDVLYQKPAERRAQAPVEYAPGQVTMNEPFPERKERVISDLILASRTPDARARLKAQAEALSALDGPDGPISRWFAFDFGMKMNNGEPVVPKEMLELTPDLSSLLAEVYIDRSLKGQKVPSDAAMGKVFEKIAALKNETVSESKLQALFAKFGKEYAAEDAEGQTQNEQQTDQYDENSDDDNASADLYTEIGTNALDPNTVGLGARKTYAAWSEKKNLPFGPNQRAELEQRAADLSGSGINSREVGAWQRLKDAYPDDSVELYKKENQLLATYGGETWAKAKKLQSQADTEEGRSKEYNTQRRLALETVDREQKFLETDEGEAAEQGEVRGSEFRVIKTKSAGNRWAVQTHGVKDPSKYYGGPEHGAVWFQRASDGAEFATSVSKLIKLGRKSQNLSASKGQVEQKEALLAGISSLMNSKETDGKPALMGFGFKRDPKGKVEWVDNRKAADESAGEFSLDSGGGKASLATMVKGEMLPPDLKLHTGTLADATAFTPQAQGAFDKYFRAADKVEKAEQAVAAATDRKTKWGAEQRLKRAKEEYATQERELRTGTIISNKATQLIEKAEREGYEEEGKEVRDALDALTESIGDTTATDKSRVVLQAKVNELYDFLGRVGFDQDEKEVASDTQMMGAQGISRSLTEDKANPNKAFADRDESGEVARKAPEGSLAFGKLDAVEQAKVIKASSVAKIRELLEKYADDKGSDYYKALQEELKARLWKEWEESKNPTTLEGKLRLYAKALNDYGVDATVALVKRLSADKYDAMYRMLKRIAGLDKDDPLWGSESWKERGLDRQTVSKDALKVLNQLEKPSERVEAPKAEVPKAEVPKAEAPKAEAPKAEAPKAEEAFEFEDERSENDAVIEKALRAKGEINRKQILAVLKKRGIDKTEIRDITGEGKVGKGVKGIPPGLFTANGDTIDLVGRTLAEENYITWDDVSDSDAVRDFVRSVVDGEPVFSLWDAERASTKASRRLGNAQAPTSKTLNIWHSSGENAALSNLASRPFSDTNGTKYFSVEHAYQTWKSGKFDEATYKRYTKAGQKIVGNLGTKTENNWNIKLMAALIRRSFEHNPDAMKVLKATGDAVLTHTQDRGVWAKEFPRILMALRDLQATDKTKANAQSAEIPVGDDTLTAEQKAEIRAAVTKRLGEMELKLSKALFGTVNGKRVPLSADWGPGSIRIAINALNPMQAGMHEAMHELFHRLSQEEAGKAMLAKLLKAANSASVVRQLERRLANHPNALMQIKEGQPDFENERLAYMYQFWQADPTFKIGPETETIFQKIANFIRQVTKLLSDDQQAELILQAFDDGKFSDATKTSVVAKVMMEDMNARRNVVANGVALAKGPLGKARELVFTAHSILAESGIKEFKELANMFDVKQGERAHDSKQGMFEARKQMSSQFLNKLKNVLDKLEKKDAEEVLQALFREDGVAPKDMKQYDAYRALRGTPERPGLLDELHDYFDTAGVKRLVEGMGEGARKEWVKIPKRKHYFPVVWDMMGKESEFAADLVKYHQREIMERVTELGWTNPKETSSHMAYAQAIATRLTNAHGAKDLSEIESSLGFSPLMTSINQRSLDWITAPEMSAYRSQDLKETMTSYIMQAVKRAEYVRRFGNGAGVIKDKMLDGYTRMLAQKLEKLGVDDAGKLAQKLTGTFSEIFVQDAPVKTKKKTTDKLKLEDYGVTQAQVDKIQLDALKEIKPLQKAVMAMEGTLGHDISQTLREMSNMMIVYQNFRLLSTTLFASMSDPLGIVIRGGEVDDAYQAMQRGFKEVWKRWKQDSKNDDATDLAEMIGSVDAGIFAESLGQTYSSLYMSGKTKWLNDQLFKWNGMEAWNRGMRVGATQAAIKFIKKHLTKPNKDSERFLIELFGEYRPELIDGELNYTDPLVQQAIMRWVDGAILSPNAAQRPMWASDPHYGLFFHMKQFTYSYHRTILTRAWNEAVVHGNAGPVLTLIVGYVPIVIAADAAKSIILSGGEEPYWMDKGVGSTLWHGMSRANLAGIPQIGLDSFGRTMNSKEGIIDATLEGGLGLAGPTTGWAKDWYDKPVGDQFVRSLPFGNVLSSVGGQGAEPSKQGGENPV